MMGKVRFCQMCQAWHDEDAECVTFEDAALFYGPPMEEKIDYTETSEARGHWDGIPLELHPDDRLALEEYREDKALDEESGEVSHPDQEGSQAVWRDHGEECS